MPLQRFKAAVWAHIAGTRRLGHAPRKETHTGRAAVGRLHVSVGKQHPPLREPIDIRRPHLRMPGETAHPVVQIVDDDHQNIRRLCSQRAAPRRAGHDSKKNQQADFHIISAENFGRTRTSLPNRLEVRFQTTLVAIPTAGVVGRCRS